MTGVVGTDSHTQRMKRGGVDQLQPVDFLARAAAATAALLRMREIPTHQEG